MTDDSGNVTGDSGKLPKIGHDKTECAVTIIQNRRSRSNGMGGHDRAEYAHVPHGCRHVVATGLKELGYPREWIELQLSHKLPGIEGVYTHAQHMAPDQRPAMMQFWADYLFGTERQEGGLVK